MTLEAATKNALAILAHDPALTATSVIEEDGNYRVLHYDPAEMAHIYDDGFFAAPKVIAVYRH